MTPTTLPKVPPGSLNARTATACLWLNPSVGNLRALRFICHGRELDPLHCAPWVDDAERLIAGGMAAVDARLAGDFLCAPFGTSDLVKVPHHGWPANSAWSLLDQREDQMTLQLVRDVMGARITKTVRLTDDSPLLYQEHWVEGGQGSLTLAHHPMFAVTGGARLSMSPKLMVLTAGQPIVAGRHRLALGAQASGLFAIPTIDGGVLDMGDLPIAQGCEDFVTMVEAPGASLGWSALVRYQFDDIIFVLKDPRVLPVTMLWHSNGGRQDDPWNERHTGVLGIEDGCTAGAAGHVAATGENAITALGVPTALKLAEGTRHRIAHVIGAIPRPKGWNEIVSIVLDGDFLVLAELGGEQVRLPFDRGFFV